jgi:GMP synthase (glutamine-hydrolysing)
LYGVQEKQQKQPHVIAIRAIQTHDFLTAEVSDISWIPLSRTAQRIFQACPNVSDVYYDITPKPPATIEME